MTAASAAMNPPIHAKDLLNVPIIKSTSFSTPKCSAAPAPVGAEDTNTVRIVNHQTALMFPSHFDDAGKIADITFHAVNAFNDNQFPSLRRGACQFAIQIVPSRCVGTSSSLPKRGGHPSTTHAWLNESMKAMFLRPTRVSITPRLT